MKMGSKQKNTPTNFNEKDAMLMHEPGHIDTDPGNSLGNDVEGMYDETMDKYSSKAGSQPINQKIIMNSGDSGVGYQALGGAVKNIIKPKGSEADFRQQERKANRLVERYKRGGVDPSDSGYKAAQDNLNKLKSKKGPQSKFGKKLRNIFK